MYSKDVLFDRLNKCKAEVHDALEKAQAGGDQKDIDFFQKCSAHLVLLMHSLAYEHVENLLEIGSIKQMAWCYNNGFLVDGQTAAIMKRMDELHGKAEQRADERHNSTEALITKLLDKGNPFDDERLYVDIKTIANVLHSEADRAENTFATRVGEMLKDVKPRYLKSKSAGKPAGYYHVPLVKTMLKRSFNIEETVAYDELIKSGRCVKDDELE
ncbi:MAG: hypothetical protein J6X49_00475 [Victivallales bacterium]|nr:hypothetical protein [Victivallales bacterium]